MGPGLVALDYGDDSAARVATTEVSLSGAVDPSELGKLCSRMLVGIERRAFHAMQQPRLQIVEIAAHFSAHPLAFCRDNPIFYKQMKLP